MTAKIVPARLLDFRSGPLGPRAPIPVLQIATAGILYAAAVFLIDGFGGWLSFTNILVLASFIGIASAGQTFVALLGGLDLSIPTLIGTANVAISQLTGGEGWPFGIAFVVIVAGGALVGAFNGFVSKYFGIHPLLVTIGTGSVLLGLVRAVAPQGGRSTAPAPDWLAKITSPGAKTGPIPLPPVVLLWLGLTVAITLMLKRSAFGRRMYFTGSNLPAADLARVRTTRIWAITFALSGAFATVTGILLAGFTGEGVIFAGDPYLFETIACVVIGGTSLLGGRGDYVRTVIGAIVLTELTTLFSGKGLDSPTQQLLLGALILLVVAIYGREEHIRNRI